MMLITNWERILIIKTEVVKVEAHLTSHHTTVDKIWNCFKSDIRDMRQRECSVGLCDTEEIQTSHLILNIQGLDGRYLLKNES